MEDGWVLCQDYEGTRSAPCIPTRSSTSEAENDTADNVSWPS